MLTSQPELEEGTEGIQSKSEKTEKNQVKTEQWTRPVEVGSFFLPGFSEVELI